MNRFTLLKDSSIKTLLKRTSQSIALSLLIVSCVGSKGSKSNSPSPSPNTPTSAAVPKLVTPVAIKTSNQSAYTVLGTCPINGEEITINIGEKSKAVTCSTGVFSNVFDMSALPDGTPIPVSITYKGETLGQTNIPKDTVAPSVAITSVDSGSYSLIEDVSTFAISGTCDETDGTVVIKIGGTEAASQVGLVCDGINFSGTVNLNPNTTPLDSDLDITADLKDSAGNSTTSSSESVTKYGRLIDPLNTENVNRFGISTAMSSDLMVVGTNQSSDNVYVYKKVNGAWVADQTISNPNTADFGSRFGLAVDTDGTKIAIGAPRSDTSGVDYGSVFIYKHNGTNWVLENEIYSSDGAASDEFGKSVSIDGTKIAIGAPFSDPGALAAAGSAYVYTHNGTNWDLASEVKITASDKATIDLFGNSLSLDGDKLLIGADSADPGGNNLSGAVYLYDGTDFGTETKFIAPDSKAMAMFGVSVFIDGDRFVVGAPQDLNKGAAYVFNFLMQNFS